MTQPRNTKYAYPEVFAGSRDLTLGVPYFEPDGLYDLDVPLAEVTSRLDDVDRVVAVCQSQTLEPPGSQDIEALRTEGFREVSVRMREGWAIRAFERQETATSEQG